MKTSIDLIAPASAATSELHRRFCSDVPNDGTYTLHLNETETIRFFAELDRLEAAHVAQRVAGGGVEAVGEEGGKMKKHQVLGIMVLTAIYTSSWWAASTWGNSPRLSGLWAVPVVMTVLGVVITGVFGFWEADE